MLNHRGHRNESSRPQKNEMKIWALVPDVHDIGEVTKEVGGTLSCTQSPCLRIQQQHSASFCTQRVTNARI